MTFKSKFMAVALSASLAFMPAGAALAAGPGGEQGAPGGAPGGASSSSNITWSGATEIDSAQTKSSPTYSSNTDGENSVLVKHSSGTVALKSPTVSKTGSGGTSDEYNFYGINAAVMCKDGGTTTITGGTITSSADGANAVFSYGGYPTTENTNSDGTVKSSDGTTVKVSGTSITTTGDGAGGIMTTGGGTMVASDLSVSTSGDSSAPIRTDRGGGDVDVTGGTYTSTGTGSPAVYSVTDVDITGATLESKASEGVVIEGSGSVELTDCDLTAANSKLNGNAQFLDAVMIYQSMSGDASDVTSAFTMTGGSLTSTSGDTFHVTNTEGKINLSGVEIANSADGVLLSVCSDGWSGGENSCILNATDQVLAGDVLVGSDSTLAMNLSGASTFTGKTSGVITNDKGASVSTSLGTVSMTIGKGSTWKLTGDCAVSTLSGAGSIDYNGHTLTVGTQAYTSGAIGTVSEASGSTGGSDSDTGASGKTAISDCTISVASKAVFTGSAIEPAVTVKNGSTVLAEGTDYTIAYANNVKAGKAKVTITGTGSYDGTATKAFIIKPAKVSGVKAVSKASGKATVKWAKAEAVAAGATGYQVRYTINGKTKTTTVKNVEAKSKVLKGLAKGKKVTVKVRAYKTVGNKSYFGAWSANSAVKVTA